VRYGRRADRGDVVLRAQASADLATWIDLDAVTESVDGNVETRRASLALDGEKRRWVRLAAERLP